MTRSSFKIASLLILLLSAFSRCEKLVEISPPKGQLVSETVFRDSATAVSAISGLYSVMYNFTNVSSAAFKDQITLTTGMVADEFYYFSNSSFDQYKNNAIPVNDATNLQMWTTIYNLIYQANGIIEGVDQSPLSETLRQDLRGEALFIRAVCHFYLTNLYGDVPLVLTTDVQKNGSLGRTSQQEVYNQIVNDLKEATTVLPEDYRYSSGGTRTRANKWAATAMLARVYLYMDDYTNAIAHSTAVINQGSLYTLPALSDVFLATSKEAILQFYTSLYDYTYIQQDFSPQSSSATTGPSFVMTDFLLNAFEPGDARKTSWTENIVYNNVTYTYPAKYKRNSLNTGAPLEYDVFLRLAEVYLIRAEAYAQTGKLDEARADLLAIRSRAGLGAPVAMDKASLLLAIEHERRVELFAEYGHRWFDLKRTKRIDAVLSAEKPGMWKPSAVLFPIPQVAISTNPNLVQNNGY